MAIKNCLWISQGVMCYLRQTMCSYRGVFEPLCYTQKNHPISLIQYIFIIPLFNNIKNCVVKTFNCQRNLVNFNEDR